MPIGESKLPAMMEGQLIFDPDGDNVELTPYLGELTFNSEQGKEDILQSGFGKTPVDARTSGKVTNTVTFGATRPALDRILNLIYGAVVGSATASVEAVVGNKSGNSLYAGAKKVYIKPLEDDEPNSDDSTWMVIFKCAKPVESLALPYSVDGQQIFPVTMQFFPDRDTGVVGQLYKFGLDT